MMFGKATHPTSEMTTTAVTVDSSNRKDEIVPWCLCIQGESFCLFKKTTLFQQLDSKFAETIYFLATKIRSRRDSSPNFSDFGGQETPRLLQILS